MTSQNPAAMANWPRLAHVSHEEQASGKAENAKTL
jgi:hypothetical protein